MSKATPADVEIPRNISDLNSTPPTTGYVSVNQPPASPDGGGDRLKGKSPDAVAETSDAQRKRKRSDSFGVPESEEEKRSSRAESSDDEVSEQPGESQSQNYYWTSGEPDESESRNSSDSVVADDQTIDQPGEFQSQSSSNSSADDEAIDQSCESQSDNSSNSSTDDETGDESGESESQDSSDSSSIDEILDRPGSPSEHLMVMIIQLLFEDEKDRSLKRTFIERHREEGHASLFEDYFSESAVYPDRIFRQRFRMRKGLFMRIVNELENRSPFFQQRPNAVRRQGLSSLQKCTAAICQLAFGVISDDLHSYLRMGNTTAESCLFTFCEDVVEIFGARYLRRPDNDDVQRLLQLHESKHGFPGMLGSLECMHWKWKNCPVGWKGQFTRGHESPTITLEAVASQDLWIWHAFFGVTDINDDINVLNESPLFNNVVLGKPPSVHFSVNDAQYNHVYFLTDEMYPELSIFVKAFPCSQDPKIQLFKERQEAARKDVERAFAVLQARWKIVRGPTRVFYRKKLKLILLTCIILHNMIVEDEGEMVSDWNSDGDELSQPTHGATREFQNYLLRNSELHSDSVDLQLRVDLVEHIWAQSNNRQH